MKNFAVEAQKVFRADLNYKIKNKCSIGPEASISPREKLKAQLPFPREDFSFPRSESCQTEEKKSPLEEKETTETFSIEGILVSSPTDTFFSTPQTS